MRVLELCAGIGGFSLAAHWMGWQTVGLCEIEPYCQRILAKNFPGVPIFDDIRTLTGESVRERCGSVDLICGGIPCQPFSLAGRRQGKADHRHLWPQAFRLITEIRPRFVVIENVAGFIRLALDDVLADLESEGYTAGATVLPACAIGAVHRRDRVWITAHADQSGLQGRGIHAECPDQWTAGAGSLESDSDADCESESDVTLDGQMEKLQSDAVTGDSTEQGLPKRAVFPLGRPEPITQPQRSDGRQAQPGVCVLDDGLPARMAGRINDLASWAGGEWQIPDPLVKGAVPERTSKLKALGNAVVPVLVYEIFEAIKEADCTSN